MSSGKRWSFRKVFTANGSCGCSRSATEVTEPKSKSKTSSTAAASRSVVDDGCNNSARDRAAKCSETVAAAGAKIGNSLAVVKDSDDPYGDFRRSMLQMIFENEIYSGDDLRQLLSCFLELNAPLHHEAIFKAFLEICNSGVFIAGEGSSPPCSGGGGRGDDRSQGTYAPAV